MVCMIYSRLVVWASLIEMTNVYCKRQRRV